jgi:proline-specific peptidase
MRVQVGDVRLYFDVAGVGLVAEGATMRERPVILCLHGGPGFDHTMLKPYLLPLADLAQLVFLDQRGNGRSDGSTPERWNLDTWIGDVPGFCAAVGIERPILLGQSFGGVVALGVAARYPELAAKLIVSSGAARIRFDRALEMIERLGGAEARAVAARNFERTTAETQNEYLRVCLPLYNPSPPDPDVLARVIRRQEVSLHFWQDEIRRFDLFPELEAIRYPTLILAGELDPITTVADVKELAAAIAGSRLEVFPDAGHGVFRDKPAETLAVIRDFLLTDPVDQGCGRGRASADRVERCT